MSLFFPHLRSGYAAGRTAAAVARVRPSDMPGAARSTARLQAALPTAAMLFPPPPSSPSVTPSFHHRAAAARCLSRHPPTACSRSQGYGRRIRRALSSSAAAAVAKLGAAGGSSSSSSSGGNEHKNLEEDGKKRNVNADVAPAAATMSWPAQMVESAPPATIPYLKLARYQAPIGSWLLFLPCTWGVALATPAAAMPDLGLLGLFGVGSVIMRGAGCTVNDMWDVEIDKKVARTASRPLAAGHISKKQAAAFLGLQLAAGLGVLVQLNDYSIVLGASSLVMVATYPLMKRITHWPQAYLGLVFNWGCMLGYSAVHGNCSWDVVAPLYCAGWSWTMIYDTIYAHQDRADDIIAGVKSTAVLLGENTKPWLAGFAALMGGSLAAVGVNGELGLGYQICATAAMAGMAHQIYSVDLKDEASCFAAFKSNKWAGFVVLAGLLAS